MYFQFIYDLIAALRNAHATEGCVRTVDVKKIAENVKGEIESLVKS